MPTRSWAVRAEMVATLFEEERPREDINPHCGNGRAFEVHTVTLTYIPGTGTQWILVSAQANGMEINGNGEVGRRPAKRAYNEIETPGPLSGMKPDPPAPQWLRVLVDEHRPAGALHLP
ncbi:hypothetical protein ABZS76_32955 [Streptomyces sp. NPDC005562]|uniref:hypothetical protein n=1 Tax=Streptomyces sp. NPDC005562 TaxID=3154890 RepID=UPI0033B47F5E